ncbi:universal stress protein [Pseudoduganella aquatica]|uniref:Universal stress protein n=1 Tax=Pseudoduganella aquatica TaxID=2660641 RepID=A0A7X4KN74_9BURK|nr:universal stress protein [Pseudoduganella aquatica]MYN08605.1 universal stress protein [Pseudoduganella aquatica]
MPHTILLPTDGNPRAAPAIERCMRLARANAAAVVGLYVLPCEDLSVPEDDSYVQEQERPSSVVHAGDTLRALETAAAAAGVPCTVLTRCADSPYTAIIAAARERQCDLVFPDAMERMPDAAERAALQQSGIAVAAGAPP